MRIEIAQFHTDTNSVNDAGVTAEALPISHSHQCAYHLIQPYISKLVYNSIVQQLYTSQ
jgi:hypothetical protein